jgi:hypothetical protein
VLGRFDHAPLLDASLFDGPCSELVNLGWQIVKWRVERLELHMRARM